MHVLDCQFQTRIVWSSEALIIQGYSYQNESTNHKNKTPHNFGEEKGFQCMMNMKYTLCQHCLHDERK